MGFFDFMDGLPSYQRQGPASQRMNSRHSFLIGDFAADIAGAKVLDLASHDGRWCYAFAQAGAASVVGMEARPELAAEINDYPDAQLRAKIDLRACDIFEGIHAEIAKGEKYDVIGVFGILYHIMDHFGLFQMLRALEPRLIIVDSEFMTRSNPVIQLVHERTDLILNAAPQYPGQGVAVKGVPSFSAMEMIAKGLNYEISWSDWDRLPRDARENVHNYFRPKERHRRRATCALRLRDR